MKFKNKLVLLITISLFLLISVGCVSASDSDVADLEAQSDIQDVNIDNSELLKTSDEANEIANDNNEILSDVPANTEIVSEDTQKGNNETLDIPVEVKSEEGSAISVNSSDMTVYNGNKKLTTTYEDATITIKDKLNPGVYNLTINFKGNGEYKKSSKNITLSIYEIKTVTSVDVNTTKKGSFKVNVTDGKNFYDLDKDKITMKITYKDGNDTKNLGFSKLKVINNTVSFTLANLNFTTATINFNYLGTVPKNITLNRIYNVKITPVNIKNEYKMGNFSFKVVDIDNKNKPLEDAEISLTTVGNIRAGFSAKTDKNGIAIFKTESLYIFTQDNGTLNMKALPVGKNAVTIGGKNNIKTTSKDINLTITRGTAKITVSRYMKYYGSNDNITITVTKSDGTPLTGEIICLYMPKTTNKYYYFSTDSNGKAKVSVKQLVPGTYSYKVYVNDTKNIKYDPATGEIGIAKLPVKITMDTKAIFYNTGNTTTIKVTDQKTGQAISGAVIKVQIYTGNSYATYRFQTNNRGLVSFQAPVSVGTHKIVVNIAEEQYEPRYKPYIASGTLRVVKSTAAISAPQLNSYYKQDSYFTMKLTNTKRNNAPIYNAKINLKLYVSANRYLNYNGVTDANGILKIATNWFAPGPYKIVISNGNPTNFECKEVTSKIVIQKAPGKLEANKITVKQGEKKHLAIKVTNTKLNKPITGVQVTANVYTGNSYKTYTLTTNKDGVANLATELLNVGSHKVVITPANSYLVASTATTYVTVTK